MKAATMERCPYLLVTAMSHEKAREFVGGSFFKTVYVGQDTTPGKRFGARVYKLFRTAGDWARYQADGWE